MADLKELYPYVRYLALKLYTECKKQGITIIFTSTYRSIEEQDKIYAQGRTTKGKIVTNAKGGTSYHNWRCAFDIAVKINGKITWDNKYYLKVGEIAKSIKGLEWGGSWMKFKDFPHYQCTGGLKIADFKKGKKPVYPKV